MFGYVDGVGTAARFNAPYGLAVDALGNVFVADTYNFSIRKITSAGVVSTIATSLDLPYGVAVDSAGNVFVAETFASTIRMITPAGVVTTLAGTAGVTGSTDGPGATALFNHPQGVAVDGAGNVFVADTRNGTVRKISAAGMVTTVVGVAGRRGVQPGPLPASLNQDVAGIAVTPSGNLIVTSESSVLDVIFH